MRVIINQALIDRYRRISHILFFVSLAGMGIGFFYTWTADPNSQTSQLSCLILPILLLMTLTSVRMANTWIREPRPVTSLSEALKGLGKRYTIFHHILPAPHVLIGPEGVFTLTTVWQERPYRVKGNKWYGEEGLMRKLNGYMRQDLLGNPFQTALFEAQRIQKLVDQIAPESGVEVQPLIVFISPRASFEAEDPVLPVLYGDPKKKPSLRLYLRDVKAENRPTLSEKHLDLIDAEFGLVTRQEIAESLGQALDHDEDGETADTDIEEEAEATETGIGTIIVAQSGQLFYIGATDDPVETALDDLRAANPQREIELIHAFQAANPSRTETMLRRKYANKRQKDNWFGLSKKDITWLKARRDENQ
jgi:hypothetical protein